MIQRPPRSTRSATLCPYTALFQPRLRIAAVGLHLDAVDEIGEFHRVLDEKDRDIVADEVPVAAVGIELDRKTAHIARGVDRPRSEEPTSELQSLMRISYAVFCLKNKQ